MTENDRKKKGSRKGVWDEVETLQDPDSKITLILSERVRGKPAYSFQIVHEDAMGPNKFVPMNPPGAKHELGWIVKSLIDRAQEIVAERSKKSDKG